MARFRLWWRTWQAAISPRKPHAGFDLGISESETDCAKNAIFFENANAGNWNILVPAGKENNNDCPSNSERKGNKANRIRYWKIMEMWSWAKLHLNLWSRSFLERNIVESDNLVDWTSMVIFRFESSASRLGRVNTALLRANFKYESKSDSEIVPRGKAEKHL